MSAYHEISTQYKDREMENGKFDLAEVRAGEWVFFEDQYNRSSVFKVKRVTKTRIVVYDINYSSADEERCFNRTYGAPVPRTSYNWSKITRYASLAEIEKAKKLYADVALEREERKRLKSLEKSVTEKLIALIGIGIKAEAWGREDDGTRTFKIVAENLTEADLQHILSL
jgi:hypothetical protein